jgi:hypothetical protein
MFLHSVNDLQRGSHLLRRIGFPAVKKKMTVVSGGEAQRRGLHGDAF